MASLDYVTRLMASALNEVQTLRIKGRVIQVVGTIIKAAVPAVKLGEICLLQNRDRKFVIQAEVVGFTKDTALLMPLAEIEGLSGETQVIPTGNTLRVPVGPDLLGRVLDGLGNPMDESNYGPLKSHGFYPAITAAPDPLKRRLIQHPLPLGIRVIDAMLTCCEGQKIGIFASAGGGKSTLMAMIVKAADVDVVVVALIGERGREVREFIDQELGELGRKRSVIVCATSDKTAMERMRAAFTATAIAEYFRDQGLKVLFLMDSVTRFARAQREIGLAAGEPPTRRGFPPSVFAALPRLMERVGMSDRGSITAIYTVLVEGDDMLEPVADETRSILDGHIVLSKKLGAANHYPAIDVNASVSRVMNRVVAPAHKAAAGRLRELMTRYEEVELLVRIGEYQRGSDELADEAIDKQSRIRDFLCQPPDETSTYEQAVRQLLDVVAN